MPTVSIIIPVYNVEKYLRRCLDSVIAQTFTNWEAICIEDACTDNSAKILDEYAARDKRFRVLHQKKNIGPSSRGIGIQHARGKYIMCLDSDDFIHPQAMEIVCALAQRDNSDMVTFTYDRGYRPRLMVRHKLGLPTDNVVPPNARRVFDISNISTRVTDDIFKYATERTHNMFNPNRRWLVKHCQVWKNMYRRDLIADIAFIDNIVFEDVPWWVAVLLKNPRTTITRLPLIFYRPNFGGIVLSATALKILKGLCIGLVDSQKLYNKHANEYQMQCWSRNFKWYFIQKAFSKIKYLDNDADIATARKYMRDLKKHKVLDNPPCKWAARVQNRIDNFITSGKK